MWLPVALLAAGPVHADQSAHSDPMPTAATMSAARPYEPAGFEAAKFGMSLAEVWKMYPKAELVNPKVGLGASTLGGPYIDRLVLREQPVRGFDKPTTVELRFWKDKLWGVIIYFGDNDDARCKAYLAEIFGPGSATNPDNPVWDGERVTTIGVYKQRWYGSSDNSLSAQATAWFRDKLSGQWKGESPEEVAAREKRMAALTPKSDKAPGAAPTAVAPPQAR